MKSLLFTTLLALVGLVCGQEVFEGVVPKKSLKPITDHNPVNVMKYSADPGVMVYEDTVYVYGTNDAIVEELGDNPSDNNYDNIHSINVMSSKDLVNWVDHGTIIGATDEGAAKWAKWSWAPAAAHKKINGKEKFFLYFANSGNGIGVLTSDSPTGPFVDPIGKELVSFDTPNCKDIVWLFDPAVFVDDDGTGYLYFGGGIPNNLPNPQNATEPLPNYPQPLTIRAAKLGDDMISIASEPVVIDAPYAFEDSGMHKAGDTYYYTYCTNWDENSPFNQARIGYMTSKNPLGPFTFQDTLFNNPGDFFKDGDYRIDGNNHHTVVNFHDQWYIFYHSEYYDYYTYGAKKGYRTTHVDYLPFEDGKFLNATGTLKGVEQLFNLNPFVEQSGALTAWSAGTSTNGLGHTTLTYNKGEWTGVSNVDFEDGAYAIKISAKSEKGAVIRITVDDVDGEVLGYVTVPASTEFEAIVAEITPVSGVKHLFFLASDDVTVDTWQFVRSGEEVPTDFTTEALDDDQDSNDEDSKLEEEPETANKDEPETADNKDEPETADNKDEPETADNKDEPEANESGEESAKDEAEPTNAANDNAEDGEESANDEAEPTDGVESTEGAEPTDDVEPTNGAEDGEESAKDDAGDENEAPKEEKKVRKCVVRKKKPEEEANDENQPAEEVNNGEESAKDDAEPEEQANDENQPGEESAKDEEANNGEESAKDEEPEVKANDVKEPEEQANDEKKPEDNGNESGSDDDDIDAAEPTETATETAEPTEAVETNEKNETEEQGEPNEQTTSKSEESNTDDDDIEAAEPTEKGEPNEEENDVNEKLEDEEDSADDN